MIDFYFYTPEIFLLGLILITLTLGIINKDSSITLNTFGMTILTSFLIFKGSSFYSLSGFSNNTISLVVLSKIILSIGSLIFILLYN